MMNHLGTTHFSRGAQLHMFEVQAAYCDISYFHSLIASIVVERQLFGKVFISVLEEELGSRS
jgi:hypothetical protein